MRSSFLFDGMLGNLCRKMRLLGYDAKLHRGGESHLFLLEAEREGRVAVTTSTRKIDRRGHAPVILKPAPLEAMIAELFSLIGEEPDIDPFSRCLSCNAPLGRIGPEEAAGRMPERILREFDAFMACPSCGRIFWQGTHYASMLGEIGRIEAVLRKE